MALSDLWRKRRVWGRRPEELELYFEGADLAPFVSDPGIRSVRLRPALGQDHIRAEVVRRENREWLGPWEATLPPQSATQLPSWNAYPRLMDDRQSRSEGLSMLIEVDGEVAGLVTLGAVEHGAMQQGILGYWIAQKWARRGVASLSVAAVSDLVIGTLGLHRVEVNVRPENVPSLALARRLGLREEGYKIRYMHINGAWCDHVGFAVDKEDLGEESLLARLRRRRSQPGRSGAAQ